MSWRPFASGLGLVDAVAQIDVLAETQLEGDPGLAVMLRLHPLER